MAEEGTKKLKISSDHIIIKALCIIFLFCALLVLIDFHRTAKGFPYNIIYSFLAVSFLLYFFISLPSVYYNDDSLFIKKRKAELEVPLKNIVSIKYSAFGQNAWHIRFQTDNNKTDSIRISPNIMISSSREFIKKVKAKNPAVIIKNWSIGINELFDK